jgi:hypothetical protein
MAGCASSTDDPVTPDRTAETVRLENDSLALAFDPDSLSMTVSTVGDDVRFDTTEDLGTFVVNRTVPSLQYYQTDGQLPVWTEFSSDSSPASEMRSIFQVGETTEFKPTQFDTAEDAVVVSFEDESVGTLEARWQLPADSSAPTVELRFDPAEEGNYTLGYRTPWRGDVEDTSELLMPYAVSRKRLHEEPITLLDPYMPTPLAVAQRTTDPDRTVGVTGSPREISFDWPNGDHPSFGMVLRDGDGRIHPGIAGPVPGTDATRTGGEETLSFSFNVVFETGSWYDALRTASDDVFGLTDYRRNRTVSLTDAVFNMIDLVKSEEHSGWDERAKGFYNIESKNTISNSATAFMVSLYRLTSDEGLYRERTLPTIEYTLSRSSHHFSATPSDTGRIASGNMIEGPLPLLGTITIGAMAELTNRRTAGFSEAVLGEDLLETTGYTHAEPFGDLATKYRLTGDEAYLTRAKQQAEAYITDRIETPPMDPVGADPFFLIHFVPDWDGLLRLYQLTDEERFLEAAAFGARQLMAGVWTHPRIPEGDLTIHDGGDFQGNKPGHRLWKGSERYRVGWDEDGKTAPIEQQTAPAWLPSNVGLTFEQPVTLNTRQNPTRKNLLIYQNTWAGHFLKLARYTDDDSFRTYARNATIGRFANYPGYYATGFTDLPNDPDYPIEGPDVTHFYYHHLPVHLGWSIDYLVSEADLRTDGGVSFPALRQVGYAFFNFHVYGHEPGQVFDHDGAWLWFDREVVTVEQTQFNYLVAQDGDRLFVVVMNEADEERSGAVRAMADRLGVDGISGNAVAIRDESGAVVRTTTASEESVASVSVPGRGTRIVVLEGVDPAVETHSVDRPERPGSGIVSTPTNGSTSAGEEPITAYGSAIQVMPGNWDAYVWLDAEPADAEEATLSYSTGGAESRQREQLTDYPFEWSVPVDASESFTFEIRGVDGDGNEFRTTSETTIEGPL